MFDAACRHGRTLGHADAIELALSTARPDPEPAPAVTVPASRPSPADSQAGRLSAKEREVMALLARGASNAEIAKTLFVTVNTVRTHLDRIREKTGIRSRVELTVYAISAGIEQAHPSS
jgi:DNA-binding CsgD family transcriptional regulator